MTTEPSDDSRNAEVVPLRPEPDAPAPGAPGVLPAIRGDVVTGAPGSGGGGAPPVYADLTRVPGERLPIIPASLRGRDNIRATIALAGAQQWHRARYHGIRSPVYLALVLAWAVAGIFRVMGRQVRWWWHLEAHSLRSQAAADGDSREYMRLHKESKETRKVRGIVLAAELIGLAAPCVPELVRRLQRDWPRRRERGGSAQPRSRRTSLWGHKPLSVRHKRRGTVHRPGA